MSGIDYTYADFRNEDGSTRIEMLWDQIVPGNPPEGYLVGTMYSAEQINLALSAESAAEQAAGGEAGKRKRTVLPQGQFIDSGIWRFILRPRRIVDGRFQMYLPSASVLNIGTRFIRPTPETTLTIPSTASRPVAVGAYDTVYNAYAGFSGRGYTAISNQVKPDIVAPGVNIATTRAGGGYASFTGTSFAAPFAAGSAALLMEWGIVRGNDAYLYGEKVKAYFQRGARHLPGYEQWPNPQRGWGIVCGG